MSKYFCIFILLIFNFISLAYLLSPTPIIPDLPLSIKSTEEGDTTQIPNVSGYFTNQNRSDIINYYRQIYTSPLFIRINHPPEKAKFIFRDPMQSYYLEEFIIPFKESLFINGYEWENDVFTKPEKRAANKILLGDQVFKTKVTIRTFPTSIPDRLISFFSVQAALLFGLYVAKKYVFSRHS